MLDLNQRPPACEAGALPTELIDRDEEYYVLAGTASTEREVDVPDNVSDSVWATSLQVTEAHDVVAVEDGAGLVACHLHGHGLRDALVHHLANSRAPEVVA